MKNKGTVRVPRNPTVNGTVMINVSRNKAGVTAHKRLFWGKPGNSARFSCRGIRVGKVEWRRIDLTGDLTLKAARKLKCEEGLALSNPE